MEEFSIKQYLQSIKPMVHQFYNKQRMLGIFKKKIDDICVVAKMLDDQIQIIQCWRDGISRLLSGHYSTFQLASLHGKNAVIVANNNSEYDLLVDETIISFTLCQHNIYIPNKSTRSFNQCLQCVN